MPRRHNNDFKSMLVDLIVNKKHSTILTAQHFEVPLKTLEKWITAYNKDPNVFNSNYLSANQQIASLKKRVSELERDNLILKNNFFISKKGVALYESISILSKDFPLSSICNALGVNKSSYLYWLHSDFAFKNNIITPSCYPYLCFF